MDSTVVVVRHRPPGTEAIQTTRVTMRARNGVPSGRPARGSAFRKWPAAIVPLEVIMRKPFKAIDPRTINEKAPPEVPIPDEAFHTAQICPYVRPGDEY